MIKNFKNIFVLAPHTDDGELGAGGTIAKLIEQGANLHYFAFSTASDSVPEGFPKDILKVELMDATEKLGIPPENVIVYDYRVRRLNESRQEILEDLISHKKRTQPDLVLMPSLKDIHQDHNTIANEGLRAFKNTTILGYELIWNNLSFDTTAFVELDLEHLKKKIHSLKSYKSQDEKDYMNEEFIYSLAKARGTQIGIKYAESFEVIRWILK